MDLKALSSYNSILKYADDTSILYSSTSTQNVQTWSIANKLQINLKQESRAAARKPRDAASVLFR